MTRVDGRYELLERMGEGTFGEVWKAQDTRFGARIVAMKFLKGEILRHPNKTVVGQVIARFDAEAEALARVAHANVVAVIDRGQWEGMQYIVMEHIEGDSLASMLDQQFASGQPTDLATVFNLFDQICAGVEAAHDVADPGPIVHRDLKPDNVMVRRDARGRLVAKVLDFGIARLGAGGMTMAGPLGTLHYMPPEQGLGDVAEMGTASDVFALGAMLVEMLTGHAQPDTDLFWWQFVLKREPEVRPWLAQLRADVPPAVWDVAAVALRRDPAQRYPNAYALREALAGAVSYASSPPPEPVPLPAPTALVEAPVMAPVVAPVMQPVVRRRASTGTEGPEAITERPRALRPQSAPTVLPLQPEDTVVRTVIPLERPPEGWHGQRLPEGMRRGEREGDYIWDGTAGAPLGLAMVWVPEGSAVIGVDGGRLDESPAHERVFAEGFWIGAVPVTVDDFARFVTATGQLTASEVGRDAQTWRNPGFTQEGRHPVVLVSALDTAAYCAWAGLRLPTEFEWEYAARGGDGRAYPWGDAPPTDEKLWWSGRTERGSTCPVGWFPGGASPVGALDMAGNVLEWTSSRYLPYTPGQPPQDDPPADLRDGTPRVIRGGCWCHDAVFRVQTTCRTTAGVSDRYEFLGFRCVRRGLRQ